MADLCGQKDLPFPGWNFIWSACVCVFFFLFIAFTISMAVVLFVFCLPCSFNLIKSIIVTHFLSKGSTNRSTYTYIYMCTCIHVYPTIHVHVHVYSTGHG